MPAAPANQFFSKSQGDIVRGHVIVGRYQYEYRQWDGEQCQSQLLGFDTETEVIDDPGSVPRLALSQVFDGKTVYLVHPDATAQFINDHQASSYVMHNCAFDWHVVYRHLIRSQEQGAARSWLGIVDDNRISDTMLWDQLLRIAYGCESPAPRNLGLLADQYLDLVQINKDDPWRLRYGEIIGETWLDVDRDAWTYAAKDPIVTRHIFQVLDKKIRKLVSEQEIRRLDLEQFGPLTTRVQVRAAIAFRQIEINGIRIDQTRREESKENLTAHITDLIGKLESFEDWQGVFKKDKQGQLQTTPTGKPRTNQKRLRELLGTVAERHGLDPPTTSQGEVSLAKDYWQDHTELEPFLSLWMDLEKTAKLCQFFEKLDSARIHPGYTTTVRTGRTSCKRPNIQQIPKASTFREMFVPRKGHVFLIVDYATLELRTLASHCEDVIGYSFMADVIRKGVDLHRYTASILNDCDFEDVTQDQRQAAKAINFGIPGGLAAEALSTYARWTYGVDMSPEEAGEFRKRFLDEIFPEIGEYMESNTAEVLATNLQCSVKDVNRYFRTDGTLGALKRIVSGKPHKRNGDEYEIAFVDRCWDSLRKLNNNDTLDDGLTDEMASERLERRLFRGVTIAPAGFVRGRTTYTQSRNTPFQSAAATGAKLAAWALFRKGFRCVAFVHDEFVIELREDAGFEKESQRIDRILVRNMELVTKTVPIETEYAIASCWSKAAKLVRDKAGRIVAWTP